MRHQLNHSKADGGASAILIVAEGHRFVLQLVFTATCCLSQVSTILGPVPPRGATLALLATNVAPAKTISGSAVWQPKLAVLTQDALRC